MRLELRNHDVRVGPGLKPILLGLNLNLDDDRCYCLVGVNGVGKTSLMLSLTRLNSLRRLDGTWQQAVYMAPRELIAAERASVAGFMDALGANDLLARWNLAKSARQGVSTLSQGEKARLALCVADALNPQVLLLDEPSAGLDMESQGLLVEFLKRRIYARLTTVVSTHDLTAFDGDDYSILYMSWGEGGATLVEDGGRILRGTADVHLSNGTKQFLTGAAAAMARTLLQMQIERFK